MRRGKRHATVAGRRRPLTILIVEDVRDQREMYAAYFTAKRFTVLTARDGFSAIQLARAKKPDIIVTDLSIPHLDGWETARRLTTDPATAHIPIIACSGHVLGGAAERALVAGCVAYVGKPCLPQDLLVTVRRILDQAA